MTDQELLKRAANAAAVEYDPEKSKPHPVSGAFWGLWLLIKGEPYEGQRRYWNPLTDDGDALRLAVDLRMDIMAGKFADDASEKDAHEQMRRSIVRVAAETGEFMQ